MEEKRRGGKGKDEVKQGSVFKWYTTLDGYIMQNLLKNLCLRAVFLRDEREQYFSVSSHLLGVDSCIDAPISLGCKVPLWYRTSHLAATEMLWDRRPDSWCMLDLHHCQHEAG